MMAASIPRRTYVMAPPVARSVVRAIDSIRETQGLGIAFIDDGQLCRLRPQGASEATVVIQVRRGRDGGPPPKEASTSPQSEWLGAGLNCGGAALAWIGTISAIGAIPVTGGLSGGAAVMLYGGAALSTAQCGVSVFRLRNLYSGHTNINEKLDASRTYRFSMLAADMISLQAGFKAASGAAAVSKEFSRYGEHLLSATHKTFNSAARKGLTANLGLQGAKRLPSTQINAHARRQLIELIGAAIGLVSSSESGVIHEIGIWVAAEV